MTGLDIRNYIQSLVAGIYYVGYQPPATGSDIACSVVIMTGGPPDPELIGFDEVTFQVLTRDVDSIASETVAQSIYRALHGRNDVSIGDSYVYHIRAEQRPFWIGNDANGNAEFSANYTMRVRPL